MIAIIDYGMGNVRSVFNALDFVGRDARITSDQTQIDRASHIILPGVGSFGDAMRNLRERHLDDILTVQVAEKGKPILGICLGLQIMARVSEEHGRHEGLGWFDAEVRRFQFDEAGLKIPHVGWNDIHLQIEHPIFANLKEAERSFYFVHSYHVVCRGNLYVAATCRYGFDFACAIARDNIVATQFHPEKSQDNGIQVIENFVNWKP
ncbi:Imidazole glycerol phosphate synthase amidotransferase subunit HisH [Olavius algarvensis associated proteobacterium Delta 3]|nr:Imidazole glycerol phosphate synthase amidotransferase subunit HisH [Olavius algarvensis associated proteobacterium Delta 3]CAB5114241.1 Imidazole glycerol phosphate synthase amidotransferase subunit HisH [Olavius algarvensis associated proteobacterium Delta 3]